LRAGLGEGYGLVLAGGKETRDGDGGQEEADIRESSMVAALDDPCAPN